MGKNIRIGELANRVSGFTLIELLVVMLIIGLLAAFVAPSVYQHVKPAKRTIARSQLQSFSAALDAYFVDTGEYPRTDQGLASLWAVPPGVPNWKGPYLKRAVPKDPWGNAFVYRSPGLHAPYEIISLGADGKEGGQGDDQDISSWESQ